MASEPTRTQRDLLTDPSQPQLTEAERAAAWQAVFEQDHGAFRVVFEHSAIGKALVDVDGRFLRINPAYCRIFGYSEEELQALDIRAITHAEDIEPGLSLVRKMFSGEIDYFQLEKRCLNKQGRTVWIELTGSIVRDDRGRPCYAVSEIQDITSRRAAEQHSASRLRKLERLTGTTSRILDALEENPDDEVYPEILRIMLECFESEAGLFLRFADDDVLLGPYLAEGKASDVRCSPSSRCELWDRALEAVQIVCENEPGSMGCGRTVSRSLVAPLVRRDACLGVLHIADADRDYDGDDVDLLQRITTIIAPAVSARLRRDKLSSREEEVLTFIVAGKSLKQIAAELGISNQTAAKHRAKILVKVGVRNDVELVGLVAQMRNPGHVVARAVSVD